MAILLLTPGFLVLIIPVLLAVIIEGRLLLVGKRDQKPKILSKKRGKHSSTVHGMQFASFSSKTAITPNGEVFVMGIQQVLLFVFTLGLATVVCSETRQSIADPPITEIIKTTANKDSEIQLEVRQMPLVQVLKALTAKTQTPIHYSVLPEGLITATCVGSSLKTVLECLLDRKADIIVRYTQKTMGKKAKNPIAEAWILGAKLEALPSSALCATSSVNGTMSFSNEEVNRNVQADQTDDMLKMAQSTNAVERADAIGSLLSIGQKGDPAIKAALEEALHDTDPIVRSQAVSTLAHRGDNPELAAAAIQEAMRDSSIDVRMMAVEGITDDVSLLKQAVNDSDQDIRSLAQLKLNALNENKAENLK